MDLDSLTKVAQIAFYSGGLVIGLLTYRRAKTTILNTVNTEYHKKVIERLSDISEELYGEFDFLSDQAWYKNDDIAYIVNIINKEAIENKESILANGADYFSGVPMSPKQMQLISMVKKYKSDPFLPNPIRKKILSLLEKRSNALMGAYQEVMTNYMDGLAKGKFWDKLDDNKGWLNNKIVTLLLQKGVGVNAVEEAVHDIRLEVQRYFDGFNPKA